MKIIFKLEIAINKKNQKTLLITGAAGYIGNSISERCAKDNINIVLVDKDKKSVFLSSENLLPTNLYVQLIPGREYLQQSAVFECQIGSTSSQVCVPEYAVLFQ